MAAEKNLIDFAEFPYTHELIFRKILLYSGFKFAENCRKVCLSWKRYLHSSNKIWGTLIRDQTQQALRLVSQYKTGVSGVGKGWLDDPSSIFFINTLDFACKDFVFIKSHKDRRLAARRLCKKMETCELLRSTKFDPAITFKQLKKAEQEVESYRTLESSMDPILEEFISSVTMEAGFSTETILQTRRIVELAVQHEEISSLFSAMKIVVVGAAIACDALEAGDMPPSLVEDFFYAVRDESSEEDVDYDEVKFEIAKDFFKAKLLHAWYHPVPSLFLGLLKKFYQKQEGNKAKSKTMSILFEGNMLPPSKIAEEAFLKELGNS